MKKTHSYEYQRVPITSAERRKLMILAAKKNCLNVADLLRTLMLDALKQAEKEGLFANLDFLDRD